MSVELVISAIVGFLTYTASLIGLMLWLTGKFRSVEVLIYKEMSGLKDEHRDAVGDVRDRVYKLEVAVFGVTNTGPIGTKRLIP